MPEGELRDQFLIILGAYMKLAFQNWQGDRNVLNDTIEKDFIKLSDGELSLPPGANLDYLVAAPLRRQSKALKLSSNKGSKGNKKRRKRKSSNGYRKNKGWH